MAGPSPNLSAAKRFQATMRANNPGIVPDKEGTARTLEAARRWQQSMRLRDPGIVGNATSEFSKALMRLPTQAIATRPSAEIATRAAGELVKRPAGEIATRAGGELVKRGAGEIATRAGGELAKRGAGEIATRGAQDIATRTGGELVKRGAGELVKQGGKGVVDTVVKQIPGQIARTGGNAIGMSAAKAVLPIAVVAAAQKGAGEFPELEKLRREEAENRRVKMQRGMQTGMGNSSPSGYRHETHMTGLKGEYKPIEDMTGYAVSLIQRGKSFDEARKLMQGTEKFRNMSDEMKQFTLSHYDTWRKNQLSSANPEGRKKLNAYLASEKQAREKAAADAAYNRKRMTEGSEDITGLRKPLRRALGLEK